MMLLNPIPRWLSIAVLTLVLARAGAAETVHPTRQAQQVEVKDVPTGSTQGMISVAPISVSIYRFPLSAVAQ